MDGGLIVSGCPPAKKPSPALPIADSPASLTPVGVARGLFEDDDEAEDDDDDDEDGEVLNSVS